MESDNKSFGKGPRELTGAVDLVSHHKLLPHHGFFCKRSLPLSVQDTHYLYNVIGDTEIRKGEGMQLDQLIQGTSVARDMEMRIQPFELEVLSEAFQLKEAAPVNLPASEKGTPTAVKSKRESKDKDKRHKKHKDRDKKKDKEHKKHKHRHKDRSKDKDKEKKKDKSSHHDPGAEHSKKHHDKKRKHDGNEYDSHKPKRSKHKSSKMDEWSAINVAG